MKKWLALVLVAVVLLGTVGCTRRLQQKAGETTADTTAATQESATKPAATQPTEEPATTPEPTPTPVQPEKVYMYRMTENRNNGTVEEKCKYNSFGDQTEYTLNGNLTRRVFEYNAQGQRTKVTIYANYSDLQGTYEYIIENGRWTKTIGRDAQGQVISETTNFYDNQGRRMGLIEYQGDTITNEMQWEYDEDGNVVRESESRDSNYKVREFRYEDGRLVSWYELNNGTQTYACRYVYENGRIVRDEWLDSNGNVGTTYQYTYSGNTCTLTGTDGRVLTFERSQVTMEQARTLWARYGVTSCFIEQ